jgi:hypothetical protein
MEELEDDSSEVDRALARANSVYRQLLFSGHLVSRMSQTIEYEFNQMYDGDGGHFLSLLQVRPDIVLPIVLRRLRSRIISLIEEKLRLASVWCVEHEGCLTRHRMTLGGPIPFSFDTSFLKGIGRTPIRFRVERSYLIGWAAQIGITDRDERVDAAVRTITREMRMANDNLYLPYRHGVCLCLAARLIQFLDESPVIDDVRSSSVNLAADIGLTSLSAHGHDRIIGLILGTRVPTKDMIVEICGLFHEADYKRAAALVVLSWAFINALIEFARESQDEPGIVWCRVAVGMVDCSHHEPIEFNVEHLLPEFAVSDSARADANGAR